MGHHLIPRQQERQLIFGKSQIFERI